VLTTQCAIRSEYCGVRCREWATALSSLRRLTGIRRLGGACWRVEARTSGTPHRDRTREHREQLSERALEGRITFARALTFRLLATQDWLPIRLRRFGALRRPEVWMSETDGKYYNDYVFNKQSVLGAGRARERTCARSGACSAARAWHSACCCRFVGHPGEERVVHAGGPLEQVVSAAQQRRCSLLLTGAMQQRGPAIPPHG
jgi:hypothetical protein